MGSRPFHQRTIGPSAAVAAALIIVGCSNTIITSAPLRDNGPDRPTAGSDELVVDAQQLDAPLVLDPLPAGLSVLESAYNPPDDGYPPSRATLYGDPTFTDTLDGPVLLVGSSSGSAVIGGPPGSAEDGRPVEVGLADGFLLKEGDRTWVPTADFSTQTATIAVDAVPPGLEPLIVGSPQDGPFTYNVGERVRHGDSTTVYLSAVRADPRLSALWGFWADDQWNYGSRPSPVPSATWTASGSAKTPVAGSGRRTAWSCRSSPTGAPTSWLTRSWPACGSERTPN